MPKAQPARGCLLCGQLGCHSSKHQGDSEPPAPSALNQLVSAAPGFTGSGTRAMASGAAGQSSSTLSDQQGVACVSVWTQTSSSTTASTGAPVVYFLRDEGSDDNGIPRCSGFDWSESIASWRPTRDSPAAQPLAEPNHPNSILTTSPLIDSTAVSPPEDERPTPCQSPRPPPLRLTSSGPSATTSTDLCDCKRMSSLPFPTTHNHRSSINSTPSLTLLPPSAFVDPPTNLPALMTPIALRPSHFLSSCRRPNSGRAIQFR